MAVIVTMVLLNTNRLQFCKILWYDLHELYTICKLIINEEKRTSLKKIILLHSCGVGFYLNSPALFYERLKHLIDY